MNKKATYHYKKHFSAQRSAVFAMFEEQLKQEFPTFDPKGEMLATRTAQMKGYTSDVVSYEISIALYEPQEAIEIKSVNGQETYLTRYEFEEDSQGMCFHVFETMDSQHARVTFNYQIFSFFLRFGKKQKWKQLIVAIQQYLDVHSASAV